MRIPLVALCLECNYSLHGLPDSRCPECGRAFDLHDGKTFNSTRPLNWLDRQLLSPIGAVTFIAVSLPCLFVLHLSLSTDIYYLLIYVFLLAFMCAAVAVLLGIRFLLRARIPPRSVPRPSDGRRITFVGVIVFVTCVMVVAQVPFRIAFHFARPDLDRIVADIQSGKLSTPIGAHRAGPLVVQTSAVFGGDDTLFFAYDILGQSGGIAYCPSKGPGGYYNAGNDGPLGGDWHWWVAD